MHRRKEVDPMDSLNRFAPFVVLIALFVVLQAALIGLDFRQGPGAVAEAFAKDYYYLDADMQKWLCAGEADSSDSVQAFLNRKSDEAAQRGFDISYLRRMFTHIHTQTISQDAESAVVHLTGTTRVAINPVFMVVGKLFRIGNDYPVDATIELIKENGRWRVCNTPLGLQS
jgi:hypothetical protein